MRSRAIARGLDILQAADGKEYVLEVNSSSIGLSAAHRAEDVAHIVEVVVRRLETLSAQLRQRQQISAARTEIRVRDKLRLTASPAILASVAKALYDALTGGGELELALLRPNKMLRPCAPALMRRIAFVWVELARRQAADANVIFLLGECDARAATADVGSADELGNCVELMVEIGLVETQ